MEPVVEVAAFVVLRREELQRAAQATAPELHIAIPPGMLEALVAAELARPSSRAALQAHYCVAMPAMLREQLLKKGGVEERLFGHRLELRRMPRLSEGLHRLFALVAGCGLSCERLLGASTPEALADGRTLGEVYARCHFGSSMPMLYAYPGDLTEEPALPATGGARRAEHPTARDPRAFIESRYVGPLVHELSHFHAREPPAPANLHEALAAFIGSEAWPAQLWPDPDAEDALPGGAYFAAVGGFLARALGLTGALRVQAGELDLREALGAPCAEALRLYGFLPFLETGAPHLLSDAFQPGRWWKLIDLHRDGSLSRDFQQRLVEPLLRGGPPSQREWDQALDAIAWRELPSWRDEPCEMDRNLALRSERALRVRAERQGLSFRARRVEPPGPLQLDRERCELRAPWPGPDAVGAPPAHPYPPPLCRE